MADEEARIMIESIIQGIFDHLSLLMTAYYEPFYFYCLAAFAAMVAITWLAWFFPVLRSLAGAAVIGIATFLYGFWKGEKAARAQSEARRRRTDDD